MKKYLLLILFWFALSGLADSLAQQFDWGHAISGLPNTPWKICSASSPDGYIVAGGYFINANGNDQSFLTRLTPDGETQWLHIFESATSCYIEAIAIQQDGTIRIGGWAGPETDIDPGPGVHMLTPDYDAFLASFSANGNFQNVISYGNGKILALHIDQNDQLFLTGMMTFNDEWDMDPGPGIYPLTPAAQAFSEFVLAKYDATGKLIWANQTYGEDDAPGNSSISGMHLGTDESGHVFASGQFSGSGAVISFKLGTNPVKVTTGAGTDFYLARFQSSNGTPDWVRVISGKKYDNTLRAMAVRPDGQIILAGGFRDTATVLIPGGMPVKLVPFPSQPAADDIFLVSYNAAGQLHWAHALAGAGTEWAGGLSWTANGDFWVFGKLGTSPIDFDPGPGQHEVQAFGLFLARFDEEAVLKWVYTLPADYAFQLISLDENGILAGARTSASGADFDLTPRIQKIGGTDRRGVVVRYNTCDIRWTTAETGLCAGGQILLDSQVIESAGTYSGVLSDQVGCDSVVTLTVSLIEVDTAVEATETSLMALNSQATFQWIDCGTGLPVAGATDALFLPDKSGTYAVIIVQDGCMDTTSCYQVTIVSTENPDSEKAWAVWPIPAVDVLVVESDLMMTGPTVIEIWTAGGQLADQFQIMLPTQKVVLPVAHLGEGSYLIHFRTRSGVPVSKPLVVIR